MNKVDVQTGAQKLINSYSSSSSGPPLSIPHLFKIIFMSLGRGGTAENHFVKAVGGKDTSIFGATSDSTTKTKGENCEVAQ